MNQFKGLRVYCSNEVSQGNQKMNKLAQTPNLESLDQAVKKAADENHLSNAERIFLKRRLESEIRVKLAEFANEISQARRHRNRK